MTTQKLAKTESNAEISVFGSRPKNVIFMPITPYSVRNDCSVGQWKVGDDRFIGTEIEVSIIQVKKFFGSLGKTKDTQWIQIFFIPAPGEEKLPKNTVCLTYIKSRSINAFSQTITELMANDNPALGIFKGSFVKHQGEMGTYYSVEWQWRDRTPAEMDQIQIIGQFLQSSPVLFDPSVNLLPLEGLSAEEIQTLIQKATHSE